MPTKNETPTKTQETKVKNSDLLVFSQAKVVLKRQSLKGKHFIRFSALASRGGGGNPEATSEASTYLMTTGYTYAAIPENGNIEELTDEDFTPVSLELIEEVLSFSEMNTLSTDMTNHFLATSPK